VTDRIARLVIVGNGDPVHVGAHLRRAGASLGLDVTFCDVREAYGESRWLARASWWLRGRRPARLRWFGERVVETCRRVRPDVLVATGIAPLDRAALGAVGTLAVRRVNYLTDDPWNPCHHAPWFLRALPAYDRVFSTRRAVLDDLRAAGCAGVTYLPFAYAPDVHFPDPPRTPAERARFAADVVFAGGADRDRVPYVDALLRAGLDVALYGGYWERFPATRPHARGHADWATLRRALGEARVALCLVRRANRDGHAMRTFEVAATGACMLTEDTAEHRELLGADGATTTYFRSVDEMVEKARRLVATDAERARLGAALYRLVTTGGHTYADRLRTMLTPAALPAVPAQALA
jgi:hypothetical protein